MTAVESKYLKIGTRVFWRGDAADSGIITKRTWHAVTIAWNNGHVAVVHHGDMGEIQRVVDSDAKCNALHRLASRANSSAKKRSRFKSPASTGL